MISNTPVRDFTKYKELENIIQTRLDNIKNQLFKNLLQSMIKINPWDRPDFIQLEK